MWAGGNIKANMKDPISDGTVLHLDCINVSILTGILCHSFTRCHHWEKWVKSKSDVSALFPTLHVNPQLSQNRKFNFKNRVRKTH